MSTGRNDTSRSNAPAGRCGRRAAPGAAAVCWPVSAQAPADSLGWSVATTLTPREREDGRDQLTADAEAEGAAGRHQQPGLLERLEDEAQLPQLAVVAAGPRLAQLVDPGEVAGMLGLGGGCGLRPEVIERRQVGGWRSARAPSSRRAPSVPRPAPRHGRGSRRPSDKACLDCAPAGGAASVRRPGTEASGDSGAATMARLCGAVALAIEPAEEDGHGARVVAEAVPGAADDAQLGVSVGLSDEPGVDDGHGVVVVAVEHEQRARARGGERPRAGGSPAAPSPTGRTWPGTTGCAPPRCPWRAPGSGGAGRPSRRSRPWRPAWPRPGPWARRPRCTTRASPPLPCRRATRHRAWPPRRGGRSPPAGRAASRPG